MTVMRRLIVIGNQVHYFYANGAVN
jgi:hypothetical protein